MGDFGPERGFHQPKFRYCPCLGVNIGPSGVSWGLDLLYLDLGAGKIRWMTLWSQVKVWGRLGRGALTLSLWSCHPRPRDTQALLSATQAMELQKCDYHVERPLLNQEQLEELGHWSSKPGTQQWRIWFQCSRARARALLLQYLPVLAWLPRYPVRDWLLGDLLSGLSVAIMQLPQGLAYALLAGLPPVFGLYSSFYPVFIYFLFGTSRHISVGTFAVMSVMVGSVTESLAPDEAFVQDANSTVNEVARDTTRVQLASTLSVLVGLCQVALGLVHFGFVVTYLSEPLVRSYTTAASVQVFVSQLKYVFGLHLSSRSGPLSLIYELVALGLSNLTGGFFQCFPVSCSMSRSLVQECTGGNTQVAGAVSSLFILLVIVKLGELFQDLPRAVLAAVIIVNLKGMLKQFSDICSLWKTNRMDLLIWLVTFVATILLDLDLGLAVAVIFSLLLVVFRTQLPYYSILGQLPDTDIYIDVAEYSEAREVPGVKVFRSSATVYFANAELYSDALKQRCGVDVDRLISQKKKLLKKQQLKLKRLGKEKQLQEQAASSKRTSVSISVNTSQGDIKSNNVEEPKAKQVNTEDGLKDTVVSDQEDAKAPDVFTLKALGLPQPDFHSLILDLSALSFVDTVCLKSLKNIFHDFREIEVEVYMAACHSPVVTQLEAGHFFDASITRQHLFASVHDAVTFAVQHPRSSPINPVLVTKL
ncbi:PREDICTED: solute carrier family 26 member 6 isoform X4 [Galeopterus variegatus]|uniref:Solute carrier family 26 member 6 isoform X4 n=1 Tax=Galeopterus variegatus TaxID=482537 RepID=A0ABM0Q6H4_GALVR|nr:PREDICTED: solute carrier family 26 member 6 isoform X4 [Galeopterus variegatus]